MIKTVCSTSGGQPVRARSAKPAAIHHSGSNNWGCQRGPDHRAVFANEFIFQNPVLSKNILEIKINTEGVSNGIDRAEHLRVLTRPAGKSALYCGRLRRSEKQNRLSRVLQCQFKSKTGMGINQCPETGYTGTTEAT